MCLGGCMESPEQASPCTLASFLLSSWPISTDLTICQNNILVPPYPHNYANTVRAFPGDESDVE